MKRPFFSAREIIDAVCNYRNLTADDIRSKRRAAPLVAARKYIAQRMRDCGHSNAAIARAIHRSECTIHFYFAPEDRRNERANYHRARTGAQPRKRHVSPTDIRANQESPHAGAHQGNERNGGRAETMEAARTGA